MREIQVYRRLYWFEILIFRFKMWFRSKCFIYAGWPEDYINEDYRLMLSVLEEPKMLLTKEI